MFPANDADDDDDEVELDDDERERLISLPKKLDIKVGKSVAKNVEFGLIDILFAAVYDLKTTDGEHSSESSW